MVVGKVHTGDENTDFQLEIEETDEVGDNSIVDLTTASEIKMIFTDPEGTETEVTAVRLNPPGTDGIIRYVNTSPNPVISIPGAWKYRAKITFSTGGPFSSNDTIFEVL